MVQELSFQGYSDRLPPQNVDAEEAILGGILLDPEAIGRVIEVLRPEAFYISAHQEIYRAALALQAQGRPTDLMSITSWLHDHGLLEKLGGQGRLAELVDRTISAVNIDQYAQLVMDKYLRRKLIQVGTEVAQLGYETNLPLEKVLDQSEQKIFGITQARPQQSLVATADILTSTFSDIESRSLGLVLPGISCGFYDLDAMTQGFQRSDLIIAAGRPSMGKCLAYDSELVLADGSIATMQQIYQRQQATLLTLGSDRRFHWTQPSAFVDDGIKPVFQVVTRLGRSIETTLTHPYLTPQGWQPLANLQPGQPIAVPRQIAVFGTLQLPIEQLQQIADRIRQVWLDPVQKQAADRPIDPDNLETETAIPAEIFQLERSQLAQFLRDLLTMPEAFAPEAPLFDRLAGRNWTIRSERVARQIQHLLLRFSVIARLQAQSQGWQLQIMPSDWLQPQYAATPIQKSSPADRSWSAITCQPCAIPNHAMTLQTDPAAAILWDEILSIELTGYKQVYDLTIPDTHNFVANDICVHNTSFVLNIARNIAAFHKFPIAVFSLEMSKEQLVYRLLSSEAQIESGRLRSGRISQNEWEPLGHAISVLSQLPVFIDDTPNISVTEMRSKCRRLQAEQGGALGLVLVDYLQLMEGSGSDNRVQELSKVTRSLKGLARELQVPVIALSQLSRGVESRTNKRPMMSDLRESGSIEQDADLIMMLYRDEYYNPDTPDRGIAEVIITKHRNGPVGTIKLLFEPQFTRFRNLAAPNRA